MKRRLLIDARLLALAGVLLSCARPAEDPNATVKPKGGPPAETTLGTQIAWLGDLHQPESVRYDSDKDVFYISNMVGFGSDKDANGYIVEVSAGNLANSRVFAENGKAGVVLDAPKGMAIHGDTLWVCDIDVMRGISRTSGRAIANIDLRPYGAVLLNDVAIGGDGAMYITDTGILMTPKGVIHKGGDRVFTVRDGKVSVFAAGGVLGQPNGITWDKEKKKIVVVSFDPFQSEMYTVSEGGQRTRLAAGTGKFDGVEAVGNGKYMVASWNDSSVRLLGNGANHRIANNVIQPADIGFDTRRNRLAIPLGPLNQMQLWQLPSDIQNAR